MTEMLKRLMSMVLAAAMTLASVPALAQSASQEIMAAQTERMLEGALAAAEEQVYAQETSEQQETNAQEQSYTVQARSTAYVATAEEFKAAVAADSGATIILTDSFSLGSYHSGVFFSGILDGQGYTISGLSVSEGTDGAYGLFAGLYGGTVKNLNITGANINVAADGDYTKVGVICGGLDNDSLISNCSVSGTVIVAGDSSAGTIFAGGLAGNGAAGSIASCTANVNVTVTAQNHAYAGGFVGTLSGGHVRDSDYSGDIVVRQTQSNGSATCQAYGLGYMHDIYARNCTVSGSVRVEIIDAYGVACGVCTADHSENNASVSGVSEGGLLQVTGCGEGWYLTNNGDVSVEIAGAALSDTAAYASGVSDTKYSENKASVTATCGAGLVYACGALNADGHVTNSGAILAQCTSGEATAIGVQGLSDVNHSFECENTGTITAYAESGKAVAAGMNGCMNSVNTGSVTVSGGDGQFVAQGLVNSQFSTNSANISGTYSGSELGGLSVQGLNGCTASVNDGSVSATVKSSETGATATGSANGSYCTNNGRVETRTEIGNAVARGVTGSYSQNHGYIFAQSSGNVDYDVDNASAYGIGPASSDSYNTGTVVSISQDGGAHAYGYAANCTDCVSTGNASATSHLFESYIEEDGTRVIYLGRAFARYSTFVQAASGGGSVSAAGGERYDLYYFVPDPYCSQHNAMSEQYVVYEYGTLNAVCDCAFMNVGIAQSSSEDSYETPEMPVMPEEPDDDLGDALLVSMSLDIENETFTSAVPFNSFKYACGSLVCDNDSYGNEYGGEFNVNLSVWGNLTNTHMMTLTLPDGFSFEPWSIVTQKDFVLSVVGGTETTEKITVYPIYMQTYSESVTFTLTETVNGVQKELAAESFSVNRDDDEGVIYCRPTAGINESNDAITVSVYDDYDLDFADCFVDTATTYNQKLANLGNALSQAIYGTVGGDTDRYITETKRTLGLSEGKWYSGSTTGGSEAYEVAVYIAQKKVAKDGEVRNILFFIVRGTYGLDWIGNFFAYGNDEGHANFIHAAQVVQEHIDSYVSEFMNEDEYDKTRAYYCGHSRGGAVVDLLCYKMEWESWGEFCSSKTAYTFAAPNSLKDAYADSDVHNIMYYNDLVGYVPFEMNKYGTTYVIGSHVGAGSETAPVQVNLLYNDFMRRGDVIYEHPDNDPFIFGAMIGAYFADAVEDLVPEVLTDEQVKILNKAAEHFYEGVGEDFISALLFDEPMTAQYIVANLVGLVVYKLPEINVEMMDGPVGRAHGAENYLAWVQGNGIAGAKDYDVVRQEWLDRDPFPVLYEAAISLVEKTGSAVKTNYNKAVNALKSGAAAAKQAAQEAYNKAVEAEAAARQAVADAADAAAQAAALKALEAAGNVVDMALKTLELKRQAEDALSRMAEDFLNSSFDWASGTFWEGVKDGVGHTILAISCPVDVQLSDASGASLAMFDHHALTSLSGEFFAEAVNETDFILLDSHAASKLNIVGTDAGSMNVTAVSFDENGNVRAVHAYLGVPVEAGETYTLDMTDGAAGGGRALVSGSGEQYESFSIDELSIVDVVSDRMLAQMGEEVTFSVYAFGGSGTLTYDYTLYKDGEIYQALGTSEESEMTYAFAETGEYTLEVTVSDESGAQSEAYMSGVVTVMPGTEDDKWTYSSDIFESVVSGEQMWIGNLYSVHYDGTWLNSWEDYEVTIEANREDIAVDVQLSEGWTDGVNFVLTGTDETVDVILTITVKKKTVTETDYDDLRFSTIVRVLAGDDVTPLTIEETDESSLFISVGEMVTIDKPAFVEEDPSHCWWVGYQLTDWNCISIYDTGSQYQITGTAEGSTELGLYAGSGYYRGDIQTSRQIIVLGEGESALEGIASMLTVVPDQKESTGGAVTWSVGNVPSDYVLSYRFDLYRNGRLISQSEWQQTRECTFDLVELGIYEVKVSLQDDTGAQVECAFTESGKALVGAQTAVVLPAALYWIADEAFAGSAAQEICLQQGMQSIGPRAFANSEIRVIRIPGTVSYIAEDAFEGTQDLAIVCQNYSWVEQYAMDHGIAYILID